MSRGRLFLLGDMGFSTEGRTVIRNFVYLWRTSVSCIWRFLRIERPFGINNLFVFNTAF